MSRLKRVNERALLLRNQTKGVDSTVDALLDNPTDPTYLEVREIKESPIRANYVEACILTGRSHYDIGEVLDIPPEVISLYAKIHYDIEDLDRLSLLALVDAEPEEFRVVKQWALSQGLEFIAWRLGKYGEVDAMTGLTSLFNDCFYKSKEAFFSSNSTTSSKESLKWMKMSMDIARLLRSWTTSTSDDAREEIMFALESVNPEFSRVEDLELDEPPDINLPVEITTNKSED